MKSKKLKVGDVFLVVKGMNINAPIQRRYYYANTPHDKKVEKLHIKVGEIKTIDDESLSEHPADRILKLMKSYSDFEGVVVDKAKLRKAFTVPKIEKKQFDTSVFEGEYKVVQTSFDGGGVGGHSDHDTYPNGHHVYAVSRRNAKIKIDFYQSGCFNTTNDEPVEVIIRSGKKV